MGGWVARTVLGTVTWVSKVFEVDDDSDGSFFGGSTHDRVLVILDSNQSLGRLIKCGIYDLLQLDPHASNCLLSKALLAALDNLYV